MSPNSAAMVSDIKYARLLDPGGRWYQFGCYHMGKWAEEHPEVEDWYNELRRHRTELPEWPITVFGPADDIQKLVRLDILTEELVNDIKNDLGEPEDQTCPTLTSILGALKDSRFLPGGATIASPEFKGIIEQLVRHNDRGTAEMICFAWSMARIHVASPPGTRKFLEQVQDLILTHCDPPNLKSKPLLAVQTAHHKLDARTVLSALNLAHMYHLKRMGNVRACKNWQEDREQLREYRKYLFRGMHRAGYTWVPSMALGLKYDADVLFEAMALAHPVRDDPDDGQATPARTASPDPDDPFWGDIFRINFSPPESDSSSSTGPDNPHPESSTAGKNAAKNRRKKQRRRLRKSAQQVVESVFHHSGTATPVGPQEQEATRATTPAPAPRPPPTEQEKKEARKAKTKAKRQRRKERRAQEATSAAPSAAAAVVERARAEKKEKEDEEVAPAAAAATALTPTPSAQPVSSSPPAALPQPVSPLRNSRLVSPSGIPLPLFWALDVDSLEEDTFVAACPEPDPAD